MHVDLSPVIAATAYWLIRAYPATDGTMNAALAEAQARQAVTVAAWLRYPTATDAALVAIAGPGGSARLDRLLAAGSFGYEAGAASGPGAASGSAPGSGARIPHQATDGGDGPGPGGAGPGGADHAWRTWVDEVVASWAACLLAFPALAAAAVAALADCEHATAAPVDFRRLTAPDAYDQRAAVLLRHPDLVAPVADLHQPQLLRRLHGDPVGTAG
ncbi:hypothetical protein RKE29_12570 [Streptomyces sp. B1866]|uniref:hypothetical protein n=1 Tax=Streptomyces sp. B1866 TaxID=3075431 RepID=UPI00288EFBAC|nr:hypothetical protein [Streptomyces sp. B1866]MDT3397473.1 hypothetical protein [Streptomyces sp. B1866]